MEGQCSVSCPGSYFNTPYHYGKEPQKPLNEKWGEGGFKANLDNSEKVEKKKLVCPCPHHEGTWEEMAPFILTLALDRDQRSTSCHRHFTSRVKKPLHPLSTRVSESHSQAEYFWRTVKAHAPTENWPSSQPTCSIFTVATVVPSYFLTLW